jgi:Protein of unknown function (DUF1573)
MKVNRSTMNLFGSKIIMNRFFSVSFLMLMIALFSCGSDHSEKEKGNVSADVRDSTNTSGLKFTSSMMDFGKMYSENRLIFIYFPFENASDERIKLIEIKSDNERFDGNFWDSIVQPGKNAVFQVVFQNNNHPGKISAKVTFVFENSSGIRTETILQLFGEIVKGSRPKTRSLDVIPAYFLEPIGENEVGISVSIPNEGTEPLVVRNIVCDDTRFQHQLISGKNPEQPSIDNFIMPGESAMLYVKGPASILQNLIHNKLEFKISIESNAAIPPIRVRYMMQPAP